MLPIPQSPRHTATPFYARPWWRLPLDVFVLGFVVYQVGMFVVVVFSPFDYYETLPDNIRQLDDAVTTYLETAPAVEWNSGVITPYELTYATDANPLPPMTVYEETLSSVVYLNVDDGFGYYIGSGVVLTADGLIATNYHVIEGGEKIGVTFSDDSTTHAVSVVAFDEAQDIALLQIAPPAGLTLTPARLRPASEPLQIGEVTYNLGHPENLLYTFTDGLVTGLRLYETAGLGPQIQISNPISQGSSGGPLFDQSGRLIGLTTWSLEYDANSVQVQTINFAIPLQSVTDLLPQ